MFGMEVEYLGDRQGAIQRRERKCWALGARGDLRPQRNGEADVVGSGHRIAMEECIRSEEYIYARDSEVNNCY